MKAERVAKVELGARIVIALCLVAAVGIALWAYPQLPEQVPSHWNAAGQVDGYSSRAVGAFLFPALMFGLGAVLLVIPLIDPLKKNIEKFMTEYHVFIAIFELFMLLLYIQTILWALDIAKISMNAVIAVGTGVVFIAVGWMLGRARRNFFIGIRTPWTLMNDEVWARTHALGARLFIGAGIISLFGAVFPDIAIWLIVVPILGAALVTVVYSYVIYQRIAPKNGVTGPPPAEA